MRNSLPLVLALALAVPATSCTDESTPTQPDDTDLTVLTSPPQMRSLLGSPRANLGPPASGDFASPLFGLATAPNGDILVADAGAGVTSLQDGGGALEAPLPGVTDVAPIGRGSLWATTGAGADPMQNTGQGLHRVAPGRARLIADLFAFEATENPDDDLVDSNPFDVATLDGESALVADAGANTLLRVDDEGRIEVVAVFPEDLASTANLKDLIGCPNPSPLCSLPPAIPADPVPTSVAVGPDGYYYVGELKGFPAPVGESSIWRVAPGASEAMCGSSPDCVKVFDGGFTSIIDLAFDPAGHLLVAELDEQSWFAVEVLGGGAGGTVNRCDPGSLSCSELATGIPILTAITVDHDGAVWATRNALIPGLAAVIEVN